MPRQEITKNPRKTPQNISDLFQNISDLFQNISDLVATTSAPVRAFFSHFSRQPTAFPSLFHPPTGRNAAKKSENRSNFCTIAHLVCKKNEENPTPHRKIKHCHKHHQAGAPFNLQRFSDALLYESFLHTTCCPTSPPPHRHQPLGLRPTHQQTIRPCFPIQPILLLPNITISTSSIQSR